MRNISDGYWTTGKATRSHLISRVSAMFGRQQKLDQSGRDLLYQYVGRSVRL